MLRERRVGSVNAPASSERLGYHTLGVLWAGWVGWGALGRPRAWRAARAGEGVGGLDGRAARAGEGVGGVDGRAVRAGGGRAGAGVGWAAMGEERIKAWKVCVEAYVKGYSSREFPLSLSNTKDAAERKAAVLGIAQMLKDTTLQELRYARSASERRAGL
jgi:hypothetical protein